MCLILVLLNYFHFIFITWRRKRDFQLQMTTSISILVNIHRMYMKCYVIISHFVNPLSPHDALKHHFTSLKTDLIFLQLRILEWIFSKNSCSPLAFLIFNNIRTVKERIFDNIYHVYRSFTFEIHSFIQYNKIIETEHNLIHICFE